MRLHLALIPLMAALTLAGCHKAPPAKTTDAQQARTVRVVQVMPRSITGSVAASGDLLPREEAAVLPEVSGYRVSRVLVDVGSWVKKGQTLVEMDPALIQAQVAQAQANALQAEANALQAEDAAKRVADLDNAGVLSQEAIDQRRFQARAARANANAQAAALRDVKTRAGKLSVASPVSGLVLERTVRPGDTSAVGTAPWFRIARDGEVELAAQLSEKSLANIRPGQHATVTLPTGATAAGVVRLVSPQIDNQTKLGLVRIHLPVRSDIRAGGFARAVFDDVGGQELAVPETSIRFDADGASVVTVGADNRVKRVPIQTGQRGNGIVQLIRGPPAGAWVVENAAAFLLDGDMVKPTRVAAAATPKAAPAGTAGR